MERQRYHIPSYVAIPQRPERPCQNCVSLAESVTGSNTNRIVGNIYNLTLTNNYAWSDPALSADDATGLNGADLTYTNGTLSKQFSEIFGEDNSAWQFTDNGLPILKDVGGTQLSELPKCMTGVGFDGFGIKTNPYLIEDAEDLKLLAKKVNSGETYEGKYFKQTANIDLENEPWTPIGKEYNHFKGIFDGGGYKITKLSITSSNEKIGLFGFVSNATIQNCNVTGEIEGNNFVGGIVGNAGKNTHILNCSFQGNVRGKLDYVGGIVGNTSSGCEVSGCFVTGKVEGSQRVGGIVGQGIGIIKNCYALADVTARTAIAGGITVGQLSSLLSYANQYTKPFNEISNVITELQNAMACAGRVFELLDETPQVPEKELAHVLTDTKGAIEIKGVNFSYVKDKTLITNLNLSVKPGMRVAIVGPTGCGKSTLINLLMRFYDVDTGSISVDGTDIRDMTRDSLRENYRMVLQETWLKSGTIRENIAYGKPDATDAEIIQAAKLAHSDSFIRRLPQGYDTVIAEDGGNLSQGQKQLLCITRVMLCLPPMLILDEATSSIDTRTEIRIQKAFLTMMKGRTSFIVAHRLSTIREADSILVMKDGKIIEQGNHDTLLAQNGFYATLYNSQFDQG